ncbi:MAG: DUF3276 family protein [Saprospiraceae bacterium]|nr:DUF3276 family protein [Saprospiraceae bacterium]
MDKEHNAKKFESVYSNRVRAGRRRTYFFDVKQTKGEDYYITLTESTKRFDGEGYERHKIFLYKEDFNRFLQGLQETIDHVKSELMPEYDYEEYSRKNQEWEEKREKERVASLAAAPTDVTSEVENGSTDASPAVEQTSEVDESTDTEEDISW